MSPIYDYRCPDCDRVDERLRRYDERDYKANCPDCGSRQVRIPSAHHNPPDGVYSYAPNIGSADAFERKQADADERAERLGTYSPKKRQPRKKP